MHIVGGGPVGLFLALQAAHTGPVHLHLSGPAPDVWPAHIELVPAPLLALLLETGILPAALDVDRLQSSRHGAWETAAPQLHPSGHYACISRQGLAGALLKRVLQSDHIRVIRHTALLTREAMHQLPGTVVDATGRRACSALQRHRLAGMPVARTWVQAARLPPAQRPFAIAALPNGYIYRAASANSVAMGWCGRGAMLQASPSQWPALLQASQADWIDLPELPREGWRPARCAAAGVQWASATPGILLAGDAAYGRDTLASQGLSLGLGDCMYLLAALREDSTSLLEEHRRAQFRQHLAHLLEAIRQCRFAGEPFWKHYRLQVMQTMDSTAGPTRQARLRRGSLMAIHTSDLA